MKYNNRHFFSMDEILVLLLNNLSETIRECQEKNPSIDMTDINQKVFLIECYLDGFKTYALPEVPEVPQVPEVPEVPEMSFEELCKLTRPPRITPKGHIGPAHAMIRFADNQDLVDARRVDRVIKMGKEMDLRKNIPYFK